VVLLGLGRRLRTGRPLLHAIGSGWLGLLLGLLLLRLRLTEGQGQLQFLLLLEFLLGFACGCLDSKEFVINWMIIVY